MSPAQTRAALRATLRELTGDSPWVAQSDALPGIETHGPTEADAAQDLTDVLRLTEQARTGQ
jgi:predicted RNase H-like HicB family nuclease